MGSIEFLLKALELNEISRTGWAARGVTEPQRVAGHTWGVAFLTLLFASEEPDVDQNRAIKIAIIHDLAETITGDIVINESYGAMSADEKEQLERQAMETISNIAGPDLTQFDGIHELWREYEDRGSPEARFVKDMDLIEVCLFALKYETESRYDPDAIENDEFDNLDGFFATAKETIRSETGRTLFREIKTAYDESKTDH